MISTVVEGVARRRGFSNYKIRLGDGFSLANGCSTTNTPIRLTASRALPVDEVFFGKNYKLQVM